MKKKLSALALALALCLTLSGCIGLGDLVYGLGDMLSGQGASSSVAQSQSQPPASVSVPPDSSLSPAPAAEKSPPPPPQTGLVLDTNMLGFIGMSNGQLRAINGDECSAYIMYGGTPVADYSGWEVPYPVGFWLAANQDAMLDIWEVESDGQGYAPDVNFWADDFPVEALELWDDTLPYLFGTDEPVTYSALEEAFGLAPELYFTAANEGENYSYDFDTWTCVYEIDGYTLNASFAKEGADYALFNLLVFGN